MDEVDVIADAWRRELPQLDVAPMQVFSRLHRLASRLERLRRDVFAEQDLTIWQFDVLAALRRAGDPFELTPGKLVDLTHVSSGTMTNRIDRLVERNLVDRRGSDGDRRIVLVRLTGSGRDAVDAAVASLMARERVLLEAIDDGDARDLANLLRSLMSGYGGTDGSADRERG